MRRRSPIWQMPTEEFRDLISGVTTYEEVLRIGFGVTSRGGGYFKTLKKRIAEENVSTSHFKKRGEWSKKIPSSEVFVENSSYRSHLKKRALNEGIVKNICYSCGQEPEWQGKTLILILDHINGINNDNRPENLQMLCPNCNSQTETFAGRNIKHEIYRCECGNQKQKQSKYCMTCARKNQEKIKWPPYKELIERIANSSMLSVANELGVSFNTVKKRVKNHNPKHATEVLRPARSDLESNPVLDRDIQTR